MKRSLLSVLFCVVFTFSFTSSFSQIVITAPSSSTVVAIGNNLSINFTYTTYSPSWRGEFYKDGTTLVGSNFQVYNNISVSTSFLTPGTYKLKVYNQYNTADYAWSDFFTVIAYPAPTGIFFTNPSSTQFTIGWTGVSGATSYLYDVSTSNTFSSFVYSNVSTTATTNNSVTVSAGTTYYVRVRASGSNGTSPNSATAQNTTIPSTPTANAPSSVAATSFTANWGAVTGATSYRLYVSTNSSFSSYVTNYGPQVVSGASSSAVTGLATNTAYYYRVVAVNSTGNSAYSNTISTGTLPSTVDDSGWSTSSYTTTSFLINWNSSSGATSYRLDMSTSSNFSTLVIADKILGTGGYYPITGLTPCTIYYVRVRAVGPYGTSPNSNTYQTLTLCPPTTANAAINVTSSSFDASWSAVSGATGYRLYVSTASNFSSYVSGYNGLWVTGTSYSVTGLLSNTTYYYKVHAANSTSLGLMSTGSNTITVGTPPVPPSGFYLNTRTETAFLIAWTSSPGAASYRLDVSTSSTFSTYVLNNATFTSTAYNAVTGLSPGTTYYCRARTVGTYGTSENSVTYVVTTVVGAPVATAATFVTPTSFKANWNASTGAVSYRLDLSTNNSFSSYVPGFQNIVVSGTSLDISGLASNTIYYYRVRAVNSPDVSSNSNTVTVSAPIDKYNYVREEIAYFDNLTPASFNTATVLQKETNTQYFDGLGRLVQTVNAQAGPNASPNYKDIVTVQEYDGFGRLVKTYLPYVVDNGDGTFKTSAVANQASYYSTTNGTYNNKVATDANPYAVSILEPSPLNRILQQGAPGAAWQPNETTPANAKTVQTNYYVNVNGTTTGKEDIYIWTVQEGPVQAQALSANSAPYKYPDNALRIVETIDEDKRTTRVYYDNRGLMILKKVQVADNPQIHIDSDWALTYYVYDIFDRLRFVLPPEFCKTLSSYTGNSTGNQNIALDNWAFQYMYDARGRMVSKNLPGATRVDMVYDDWDRLVLTQDGVQRAANKWSFNKYDVFNRAIISGEISSTNDRATMASAVLAVPAATGRYENSTSGNVGYTLNLSYPTAAALNDINLITYYDDYNYKTLLSLGTGYDYSSTTNTRVKNLGTGSKARILGSSNFLVSANYFDDRYRLVQSVSDDHRANKNRVTNVYYGITSRVLSSTTNHGSVLTKLDEAEYDQRGRVTKTYTTMDGGTKVMTSALYYNDLGQIVDKKVHSTDNGTSFLQSIDYRYNIRGWNTHINNSAISNDGTTNDDTNDLFGMELKYNTAVAINGNNTTPQFGGNLASIQWSTNNLQDPVVEKVYGFEYDRMNRLKDGTYAKKISGAFTGDLNLYNEHIEYDYNGNILKLNRNGLLGTTNTQVDKLEYTYTNGNQLSYVDDKSPYYSYSNGNPAYGYIEDAQYGSAEYTYNDNGAMTSDANKKITSITYNILNLPVLVTLSGSRTIEYTWSATGKKLKKLVKVGTNVVAQSDYVNDIQYESDVISFVVNDAGRIIKTNTGWDYEYSLKDHLGNTRVTYGVMKVANIYTATMEDSKLNQEAQDFRNITETRIASVNRTPTSALNPIPNYASSTKSTTPVGPAKMLAVKQNDAVTLTAYARFNTTTGSNTLIANVANAVLNAYGLTNVGEMATAFNALNSAVPTYSATVNNSSTSIPKSYLAYVLFNSSYTASQFGFQQISNAANGAWETLSINLASIPNDGYLYAYVINESGVAAAEVYFDDVTITHVRNNAGLLVTQTNDYYPFGMSISALSYQNQATNRNDYKYNGKELQDEFGLNWLDYGARMYMPDIARWGAVDPMSEKARRWTPYRYGFDNPMRFIDPDGMYEYSNGYQKINSETDAGAVSNDGTFDLVPKNIGKIVIQVLVDEKLVTTEKRDFYKGVAERIDAIMAAKGVNVKAEVIFNTKILSKKEFITTNGRSPKDSYILVGTIQQLVKADKEASEGGWKTHSYSASWWKTESKTTVGYTRGSERISFVSKEDLDGSLKDGFQDDGFGTDLSGISDRLTVRILHEAGHAVFWNILVNFPPDHHYPGTIMAPIPRKGFDYTPEMIQKLKEDYGTTEKIDLKK